jgi:type I restriction enzyme S subunit
MSNSPRYKQTEIGEIPVDWQVMALNDALISPPQYGITKSAHQMPVGSKMLRTTDVKDYAVDWNALPYCECTNKEFIKYQVKAGDIIIARAGSVGVSIIAEVDNAAVYGSYMIRIHPIPSMIQPTFLHYFLKSAQYWRQVKKDAAGSTLHNINTQMLKALVIPRPPIKEQEKIASILSVVDNAVQTSSSIIAKTEQLKRGLMQQLLTKGIGHTDFKQTELGEVPQNWRIIPLGDDDVCGVVSGVGFPIRYQHIASNGTPFIKVDDMNHPDNTKYMLHYGFFVNQHILEAMKAKAYPKGTVIFPKVGAALLSNKRRVLSEDSCFDNNIMGLIPHQSACSEFLYYLMLRIKLDKWAQITSLPAVNQSTMDEVLIALPPLPEQQAIVTVLSTIDNALRNAEKRQSELERLKTGLMQILLTGHVRVQVN